jgi:hypothetical protein
MGMCLTMQHLSFHMFHQSNHVMDIGEISYGSFIYPVQSDVSYRIEEIFPGTDNTCWTLLNLTS